MKPHGDWTAIRQRLHALAVENRYRAVLFVLLNCTLAAGLVSLLVPALESAPLAMTIALVAFGLWGKKMLAVLLRTGH